MKKTLLLLFCCLAFTFLKAQNKHEKIRAAKVAFISEKLNLSPMEAEDFWPLYNEYSSKRRTLRREKRQLQKQSQNIQGDDALILKNMDRIEEIQMQEVALDKSYRKRFLIILTPEQVMTLYQAEREFLKMLKDKIKERQ